MDERGDQVRVVDLHWQFVKDVLVAEAGLLQSAMKSASGHANRGLLHVLLGSKLVLPKRSHELVG